MDAAHRIPTAARAVRPARRVQFSHVAAAGAAVLLAAHGVLGLSLLHTFREKDSIEQDIAIARRAVRASQAQPVQDLAPALREAQARLAGMQEAFPERVDTTAFIARLLEQANAAQVRVTNVTGRPSRVQAVGQHTYRLSPLTIMAEGLLPDLTAFLDSVEQGAQHTVVVRRAEIALHGPGATLTLEIELYGRGPAAAPTPNPTPTPRPAPRQAGARSR